MVGWALKFRLLEGLGSISYNLLMSALGVPAERVVALTLIAIFGAIGLLHLYWAVRGVHSGGAAIPTRENGKPVFLPSRATTMMVVFAFVAAIVVMSGRAGLFESNRPLTMLWQIGTWVLGTVFLARAIGDFRYVGLFKRERASKFAEADTRYFTPLCIALACGVFFVAYR